MPRITNEVESSIKITDFNNSGSDNIIDRNTVNKKIIIVKEKSYFVIFKM